MLNVKLMLDAEYALASVKYTGPEGLNELETYWSWVYTSFDKYIVTGDATHLNRVVGGALNVQRFRPTMRVIGVLAAHKFDEKAKQFGGKAIDGKFDKLKRMVSVESVNELDGTKEDGEVMFWDIRFFELLNTEEVAAKKTPVFDPKKWEAAFIRTLVKGLENGEEAKLSSLIEKAKKKVEEAKAETIVETKAA